MTTFSLCYWSAYDATLLREGAAVIPHQTTLIAPQGWDQTHVSEAFLRHHPGSRVISCHLKP